MLRSVLLQLSQDAKYKKLGHNISKIKFSTNYQFNLFSLGKNISYIKINLRSS